MATRKKNRWLVSLLIVILLGGTAAGWHFYVNSPKNALPDYRTVELTRGDITQTVTASGMINAVKTVQVGTQVSGIIKDIAVDFNAQVRSNQIIAQIDPSTYQQIITQSEAELANARAALELTQVNFKRAKELRANDLISQSEYDKALADLHQAEAVVTMREAALNKARVDLERTTIYAPIDGVVISRNVDVGQTVAASFNTPTLFLIANDLTKMQIEALVSEADVGGVEVGQKVNFTVEAFPTRQFQGLVKQVRYAPITNQNVVNYTTIVEVDNPDLKLRPGMTATASIITAQHSNVLRIPNAALRFRPPEGVIKGTTNALSAGSKPTSASATAAASGPGGSPPSGMPTPPWVLEGRQPTREERQKWMNSLTPEQRDQMQRLREQMRAGPGESARRGGDGATGLGTGPGTGYPRSTQEGPVTRTIYVLDKQTPDAKNKSALKPVTVKVGISDGVYTEVLDGLKEGDLVVTGVNTPPGATASSRPAGTSPFGGPFGGPPRRP
jgi:HlyD family secretion protein